MHSSHCWPPPWPDFWSAASRHGSGGRHGRRHGGPPPWFHEMFGGPPPRAERGEVRYLILDALADQPRHGYEVIQTIEQRSEGAYRPSPGTVYPTLQMLEEMGQVSSTDQGGRKVYQLTDEGRAELEAHRDDVQDAYERFCSGPGFHDPGELHDLVRRLHRLMRTVGKAFRRGTLGPRKWRQAQKVIHDAADEIERIVGGQ